MTEFFAVCGGVRGLAIVVAFALAVPTTASAVECSWLPMADDQPFDDGAAGGRSNDGSGPAQRDEDEPQPYEDETEGQPDAAAPQPPSGCQFRDGPLELVV